MRMLLFDLPLFFLLLVAVSTDIKSGKIYNRLTFPAFGAGILLHTLIGGWKEGFLALQGGLLGIALFFPFFALGWLKAGDVKLLAVVGAWQDPRFVLHAAIFTVLSGGCIAFCLLLRKKLIKEFSQKFMQTLFFFLSFKKSYFESNPALFFPYSLSILLGTLFTYLFRFLVE